MITFCKFIVVFGLFLAVGTLVLKVSKDNAPKKHRKDFE